MRAKLLKEQMGVLAGTEMEVLGTGRAWTLKAPAGAEIVVPACDAEMVPDTEPFSEPKPEVDPEDPGLLVNIFGGQPQPEAERTLLDDERDVDVFPQAEPVEDDHDPKWEDSRDEASDPHPDDEEAYPEAEPHFSTAPSDLDESKPVKAKKAAKKKAADD